MVAKKGGIPFTEEQLAEISRRKTEGLTRWNKLDALGHMDGYQAYIGFEAERPNHIGVIRAFREATRNIAHSEIIPTTVGISGPPPAHMKNDPTGFEFSVTSDVSEVQGREILAEVKLKTGACLFIR